MLAEQDQAVVLMEEAMGELMRTCGCNDAKAIKVRAHAAWRLIGAARLALMRPAITRMPGDAQGVANVQA